MNAFQKLHQHVTGLNHKAAFPDGRTAVYSDGADTYEVSYDGQRRPLSIRLIGFPVVMRPADERAPWSNGFRRNGA